jgi:hypothetical protein
VRDYKEHPYHPIQTLLAGTAAFKPLKPVWNIAVVIARLFHLLNIFDSASNNHYVE